MKPEVSVVIAAKNEALHVEEAVRSILGQEGVAFELVFVDDHSDDDTFAKVSALAEGRADVRVVRNPGRGKVSAFNHGVALARGKWTTLFAGDDVMPPGALAARVGAVRDVVDPRPVVGVCRLMTMSEDPKEHGHFVPRRTDRGTFSGACYMFSPEFVALAFPVPEMLPNEDTWLEIAATSLDVCVVHSGVVGIHWRIHAGNSINLKTDFDTFNSKLTPRMAAIGRFLQAHDERLKGEARRALEARFRCEEARKAGDLLGILKSGASPVEKLRAISLSGPAMYEFRTRFYGLLSGW